MKRSDYSPIASTTTVVPMMMDPSYGGGGYASMGGIGGGSSPAMAAPDQRSSALLAEIGNSYFWNMPLRGPSDHTAPSYFIEGLQSIDITLETLPMNEGYRQVAITFVDHLVTGSLAAIRNGRLIAPIGLEERLDEFSLSWRLIGIKRAAVLDQAAAIADMAVELTPGKGIGTTRLKGVVAGYGVLFYLLQLALYVLLVVFSALGILSLGVVVGLLVVCAVADGVYKHCVVTTCAQSRQNQRAFDIFAQRMARLVSSNLPLGQFAALVDTKDEEGSNGDAEADPDVAEEVGEMFAPAPFLLADEEVLQRKQSIDEMLGEADDEEGCVILKVKGFPKATINLPALGAHLLMVVTGLDGKVHLWNDGATAVTGFGAHDAEGMKISSFLFGDTSASVYARMVEAAVRQGDTSAKPLTLANATYGQVTVRGSVALLLDSKKETVGYVLLASQHGESSAKQSVFHQYYLAELVEELKRTFFEFMQTEDLGRCGHILGTMRWNYLRDLASAAKDWHSVVVQGLLNEALRDRHRQVDVRMDPKLPDQIVCDQLAISRTVARTLGLLQGKLRLSITQEPTNSHQLSQLHIIAGPASDITEANLGEIYSMAVTVGGEALFNPKQEIHLIFPYLVEGVSSNLLADHDDDTMVAATAITILLFEKNAVHRHNISTIAFAGGHSVRIVEHVADALRALSEGSSQFGCAMVDIDARDIGALVDALRAANVYTIEMTEQPLDTIPAWDDYEADSRRIILSKPVPRTEVEEHLSRAADIVATRRREEDRITKQRAILSTQRNSPWVKGKKLGHGAFANVFEATSTLTGGKMAVKMIRLRRGRDEADKAKTLLNEIEILCQLQHPNIIHYFYCEPTDETLNLFMELATGGSMQDLLNRDPVLPEARVAFITRQLLLAVRYLHDQDIIHRDIKPGNILLSGPDDDIVKLTDFGTATQEEATDTQGTIEYMAPEVLGVGFGGDSSGEGFVDSGGGDNSVFGRSDGSHVNTRRTTRHRTYSKECDIWSVGCVVCKCLGIDRPKRDDTLYGGQGVPTSFPSNVSQAGREFIMLCLQEDPSERAVAGTLLLHDFVVNAVSSPARGNNASVPVSSSGRSGGDSDGAARPAKPTPVIRDDPTATDQHGSVMSVWTDEDGQVPQKATAPPAANVKAAGTAAGADEAAHGQLSISSGEGDGGPLSIASDED